MSALAQLNLPLAGSTEAETLSAFENRIQGAEHAEQLLVQDEIDGLRPATRP